MRDLIRTLSQSLACGDEVLHCQVVETKGSTPQKAGARMLVDPSGGQVGTLGGGCVENEVKQKTIRRIGAPGADLHAYVLDHDYAWADGLICGGKMQILSESLQGPAAAEYYATLLSLLEAGNGLTELVAVDAAKSGLAIGSRVLFDERGQWQASLGVKNDGGLASALTPLAQRPRPSVQSGIAHLPVLPRVRLVIVGAGHVGQAVGDLAAKADFDVWVVDDRRQYANADRFPLAKQFVVGPMDEVLPSLEMTDTTYALIVTRGHGHDQEAVYHLAPTKAAYVGLIGSKRKIRMIFESLREAGLTEESLSRVSAPVGLDIGSESVIEIAVSIVAELIARRNRAPVLGSKA